MKKKEIYKGNRGQYLTYTDEQSLEETHDMLVKALPGQSYIKETFHKVNTNQVTGEALKKVSVGGKGGFASSGDARDQEKQVEAVARVMVMSGPAQEAFDHNALLKEVVKGFIKRVVPFTGHEDWVPIIGPNKVRDYDEFVYTNQLDPSDKMLLIEKLYGDWDAGKEFIANLGLPVEGECPVSKESVEWARGLYDELCGYRGAWKYVGYKGAEHRRYRISIVNTLNQPNEKQYTYWKNEDGSVGRALKMSDAEAQERYKNTPPMWTDEHSSSRHHKDLHFVMNKLWRDGDEEAFNKAMMEMNNDHAYHVMWYLDQSKPEMWSPIKESPEKFVRFGAGDWRVDNTIEYSDEYLELKAKAEEMERKRRLKAFKNSPELKDWKIVYKWELTKNGKTMFANEKL